MQNVGNTYQGKDAVFAVNGRDNTNVSTLDDSSKGIDFSNMLGAIKSKLITSADSTLYKNNFSIQKVESKSFCANKDNAIYEDEKDDDKSKVKKHRDHHENKSLAKDCSEGSADDVFTAIPSADNDKVPFEISFDVKDDDKSKVTKHRDHHENKSLAKDCSEGSADDVFTAILSADNDKGPFEICFDEQDADPTLNADLSSKDEILKTINTVVPENLGTPENTSIKFFAQKTEVNTAESTQQKDAKTLEQNIAVLKDDMNLSDEDASALLDLILNADDLDLETLTKEKLEVAVDKFYKGQLSINEMIASLKTDTLTDDLSLDSNVMTDTIGDDLLNSLLKGTNTQKVTVSDPSKVNADTQDFGESFFSLLEEQYKMQQSDKDLADADVQSKINKLMDAKDMANQSTLENSLALLRQAASGMSKSSSKGNRVFGSTSAEITSSLENLQNSISNISAGSNGSASENMDDGKSFDNRSLSQINVIHDLMGKSGHATSKELFAPDLNKTFNMMNMSRNLKENAQALTEKVMMMSSRNLKNVVFDLNPEGLGKVKISLDVTGADDIAKISISASSSSTKALIEGSLEALKETLRQNNITADAKVVDYDDGAAGDGNSSEHGTFADNGGNSHTPHQNNEKEEQKDTIFASNETAADDNENVQLNDLENIINSQNDD